MRPSRSFALPAAAALLLAGIAVPAAQPAQAAPPSRAATPRYASEAADIASARVLARLSGKRVEALAERDESTTTWVNPDGSLTSELSSGPVRFKRAGKWVDIDLTLQRAADGTVAPKAHPEGLRLAAPGGARVRSMAEAGTAPARTLVTLGEGDRQIALQWKGGLPEPEVDGTTVTYPSALPGADVVVEATRTGFEQYTVIKQRPATSGYSYTLPLRAPGLTVAEQSDGSLVFTDSAKRRRAVMPAPVMWDASTDPVSGEHTNTAPVDMRVVRRGDSVDLVLTPDASFLADPATAYPVTVDPTTAALGNVFDTRVQEGETVDWSADTELYWGNPGTTNPDGSTRYARSFLTWNTAPIADSLVMDADVSLYNFHSGNSGCAAQTWQIWDTTAPSTASRWGNQPAWNELFASPTQTKGRSECGGDGWITSDVTRMVSFWAGAKYPRSHMGLRAPSAATAEWKQVNSGNAATNVPKLTVTYNYRPRTGTKQEAGPPYFSYGGAYTVNTTTPTLRDTFVDSNGDKVQATFQVFDAATNTQVGTNYTTKLVPSGQVAAIVVPAGVLTDGKTYKFRTNPYDGTHYSTVWSAWKTFTVDTTRPSAPQGVTSTDYPSGQWVKGAGQPGKITVTPPAADHNWLEWSLDGSAWAKVGTGGAATAVAITVTPARDGEQTFQVRSVDKADNKSEVVTYPITVGPGGFLQPDEGDRTARRLPLAAQADAARYTAATFSWRRSAADAWTVIPAAQILAGGTPVTAQPVPLTNGRTADLVWNATDTVGADGSVQLKADFTGPNAATGSSNPLTVVVDRNADGAAAEKLGPGSVNLLTGDYTVTETDVSAWTLSATRTLSSRVPDKGATQEGQAPIFGKEWVAGTIAMLPEFDGTHIRRISDTAVTLVSAEGEQTSFTANAARTGWVSEPGAEELTLTGTVTGTFTLTDTDGVVSVFAKPVGASQTWQLQKTELDGLADSTTTVVSEAVTVGGKSVARPKRVVGPTSAVSSAVCGQTPATKGCRVLEYVYATATTATGDALGDVENQVKELRLYSTEPGAAASTARTVQAYAYDGSGRLREAWNPLITPAVKTRYAYDTAGHLTQYTRSGDLPWSFGYDDGRLLQLSRPTLAPGSTATVDGEAKTSLVYDVPVAGTKAPYQMGAANIATWGQRAVPTDATAVFLADSVPAAHTGGSLAAGDYGRASIHYLDASGREANMIVPGGHVSTSEHDRFGNTVRDLTAANRSLALGLTAADREALAELGISALSTAERAELLSTRSLYDATGTRQVTELGPLRRIELTADLKSGSGVLLAAGSSAAARTRTDNEYDGGRPTDGTAKVRDQITRATSGAQVLQFPGVTGDARVTETSYDWAKGLPVRTVTDPGGLAITSTSQYDAQGRVIRQVSPGSAGTDSATQVTTYWSATGSGACQGRPEWADQLCTTGPAGAITGGGSNPAALPVSATEYDWWGNPAKVTDTANGVSRVTSTSYDPAGRPTTVTTTGGVGTAVPVVTTEYDQASGRAVRTVSPTAGTITKGYDALGRLLSYTNADGGRTTTEYDRLNRPTKVSDTVPSTVTYLYDHSAEPRGLATQIVDSVAGTFQPTYDAGGSVSQEKLPGGYTLRIQEDATGSALERAYTRDSDGVLVFADTVTRTVHDQVASHAGWSDQTYGYDATGRLSSVQDTADTVCTTRGYTFDSRGNRRTVTTAAGAPGADCPAGGGTTTGYTYDSADRLAGSGYVYDAFGRATTAGGNGTVAYFVNDLPAQQTSGSNRQTWSLDPAHRVRTTTAATGSGSTWTTTGTKVNHYCSDSDTPRWIVEDSAGNVTRNVTSATGDLTATTGKSGQTVLQLSDIHGDVSLLLPLDTTAAPIVLDHDENGKSRPSQGPVRYGWLGAKQRAADTVTGLVVMGVRLYDPVTGRFLSVDPIYGGGDNLYGYPADPVNQYDLDGQAWKCKAKCALVGNDPKCTGYVWGAGSGKTESDAKKAAKKDASSQAPRGCRTKHCDIKECTKNRFRQFFDGNFTARIIHQRNPPDWMRRANRWSWGIAFYSEVWRGTYGSFCGCGP
ncbi:DNRLRE domain-containing protein [Actinoplanes sp. CA-051413]|uniref:DNRLRE domain-containing protein n=1 Tax=Actinoplanes sp. CA-051413 TaxID=3239899 RepID=UPI003D950FB2